MRVRFALLFGLLGCQSKKAPDDVPPARVVALVTEEAAAPVVDTGVMPVAGGPCTTQVEPIDLDKAPCNVNADCVLTDVPQQCNACNAKSLYPALKKSVDVRNAYCAPLPGKSAQCSTCCIPQKCPPHDTYSPAFYRAECRGGRCVAFRWHSGG